MEAWIPITVFAAFFQNVRSALQKHLKGKLSDTGAAYVRFVYALPFVVLYLVILNQFLGLELPEPNPKFFLYCFIGGICQILFTVMLLWMFSFRSFAVGTTFSKLEIVAVAILGSLVIGDLLNIYAWLAILLSAIGLTALSLGQSKVNLTNLLSGLNEKTTLIGLGCAAFLGGSVVFFRGASLSLAHDSSLSAATFTLTISLIFQTFIMTVWLLIKEPGEISRVIANWRWASAVGAAASFASMGWFIAFTLQNASYVRALGQIELVFTFLVTSAFFREKVSPSEYLGAALIVVGIFVLLFKA